MKLSLAPVLLFAVTAATACAQEQKPAPQPAPQQVSEQDTKALAEAMQQQFAKEGIALDAKAGTITIQAVANQPPDPIEYLLIYKRGKRHESLFITESKPSVLHAAFLLLGVKPGKNASAKEKVPAPSLEEVQKGADPVEIVPPQGDELFITVKWQGADGKPVEYCVEDLIVDLQAREVLQNGQWIYFGGRMGRLYKDEPEVFLADVEGNLISCCYLSPDNHLATLRHARARDDENWWFTKYFPEPGTKVELTFWRQKPKLAIEREQRLAAEAAKQAAAAKDAPKDGKPAGGKRP